MQRLRHSAELADRVRAQLAWRAVHAPERQVVAECGDHGVAACRCTGQVATKQLVAHGSLCTTRSRAILLTSHVPSHRLIAQCEVPSWHDHDGEQLIARGSRREPVRRAHDRRHSRSFTEELHESRRAAACACGTDKSAGCRGMTRMAIDLTAGGAQDEDLRHVVARREGGARVIASPAQRALYASPRAPWWSSLVYWEAVLPL